MERRKAALGTSQGVPPPVVQTNTAGSPPNPGFASGFSGRRQRMKKTTSANDVLDRKITKEQEDAMFEPSNPEIIHTKRLAEIPQLIHGLKRAKVGQGFD
mgnify:FL=1